MLFRARNPLALVALLACVLALLAGVSAMGVKGKASTKTTTTTTAKTTTMTTTLRAIPAAAAGTCVAHVASGTGAGACLVSESDAARYDGEEGSAESNARLERCEVILYGLNLRATVLFDPDEYVCHLWLVCPKEESGRCLDTCYDPTRFRCSGGDTLLPL